MGQLPFARGFLLIVLWGGIALGGCGGGTSLRGSDFVLAPELVHYGASYSGWSARWWQWCYELPLTNHPLFDHTGADAPQGQVDPVWFLGGTFDVSGSETRSVTIPNGVALFFPIINVEWDNTACVTPDTDHSISELRAIIDGFVKDYTDLRCEIDGDIVLDAPNFDGAVRFRAQSPVFTCNFPDDNLFVFGCGDPATAGVIDPTVSDGIWMMVAPMPPGLHTIHFTGTYAPSIPPFVENITYNITVTP